MTSSDAVMMVDSSSDNNGDSNNCGDKKFPTDASLPRWNLPRDFLPTEAIKEKHVTPFLSDKNSITELALQKVKMEGMQSDLRAKLSGKLKKKIHIWAKKEQVFIIPISDKEETRRVGSVRALVGKFKDLSTSWKNDPSPCNAKKLWMALFGNFDSEVNWAAELAKKTMDELNWHYNDPEVKSENGKVIKGFVERYCTQMKGELVRAVLREGEMHHGWSLGLTRSDAQKKSMNKHWKRKAGVFYPFFRRHKPSKMIDIKPSDAEGYIVDNENDNAAMELLDITRNRLHKVHGDIMFVCFFFLQQNSVCVNALRQYICVFPNDSLTFLSFSFFFTNLFVVVATTITLHLASCRPLRS
jgi:flavin-binding protein dodecin